LFRCVECARCQRSLCSFTRNQRWSTSASGTELGWRRGGGGEAVEGEGGREGMRRIRGERAWKRKMGPGGRNEKEGEGREH